MAEARRTPLSREVLIDAALRLLDEVGLDGLTVRRLAADLGVRSPALYWHIRTKQELLDGIADRIVTDAGMGPPREGESWQGWLVRRAGSYRRAMLAHRDAARIVATARSLRPDTLIAFDQELAALVERGFSPALALRSITAVTYFVNGFVLQEQLSTPAHPQPGPDRGAVLTGLRTANPHSPLLAALGEGVSALGDDTFAHGLAALIEGTAAILATEAGSHAASIPDHAEPG